MQQFIEIYFQICGTNNLQMPGDFPIVLGWMTSPHSTRDCGRRSSGHAITDTKSHGIATGKVSLAANLSSRTERTNVLHNQRRSFPWVTPSQSKWLYFHFI